MPEQTPALDVRLVDGPLGYVPFEPHPQPGGGECVFFGRTRAETHERSGVLTALTYEAYRPMAERVLDALARDVAIRHDCAALRVLHRLGPVPIGEASVLIQVVTGHRDAAFAACRTLIDRLKSEAPIWKREEWADGAPSWSSGTPYRGA